VALNSLLLQTIFPAQTIENQTPATLPVTPVTVPASFLIVHLHHQQSNQNQMGTQIVTLEDLYHFKTELFAELRELLKPQSPANKKWLKTCEVRDMLGLSSGTLQTMRSNGTISYTKIGGLVFYAYDDIIKLMEAQKKGGKHAKNRF
jgi:subtilase family serine protease